MSLKKQIIWSIIGGLVLMLIATFGIPEKKYTPMTHEQCLIKYGQPCPARPLVITTPLARHLIFPIPELDDFAKAIAFAVAVNWFFWAALVFMGIRVKIGSSILRKQILVGLVSGVFLLFAIISLQAIIYTVGYSKDLLALGSPNRFGFPFFISANSVLLGDGREWQMILVQDWLVLSAVSFILLRCGSWIRKPNV